MTNDDRLTRRYKSNRLREYDYSRPGGYFVTLVSADRACLFGEICDGEMELNAVGNLMRTEWLRSAEIREELTLNEFVIMPNHVHGIVMLGDVADCRPALQRNQVSPTRYTAPRSLSRFIAGFKAVTTKQYREMIGNHDRRLWQPSFHDRIIRDEKELSRIREYIVNNPLKWDLDKENPDNL